MVVVIPNGCIFKTPEHSLTSKHSLKTIIWWCLAVRFCFLKGTTKDTVNYAHLHSVLWRSLACSCRCPLDTACSLFFSPVPRHGYTVQAQLWPEQCHQRPRATWRTSPVQRWDGGVVGLRSQLVRRSTGEVWQRLQRHPSGLCKWKTMRGFWRLKCWFVFVNSYTFSTPRAVLLVPGP